MREGSSGLEREVSAIVRREVGRLLAPLADALGALARGEQGGGRGAARESVAPARRRGRRRRQAAAPATEASRTWDAKSIRALRKRLGLTQAAFAERVGVTPVAVYLGESGKTTPRGRSAEALTTAASGGTQAASAEQGSAATPPRRAGRRKRGSRAAKATRPKARRRRRARRG
jgi:DNA-binding transcriptional regulator YiaG